VYYYHHVSRPWNGHLNRLYRYDTREKTWTSEQVPKGYHVGHGSVVNYFKPLNALVEFRTGGGLSLYDLKTKKWSRVPAKIQRGDPKKKVEGIGSMEYVGTVSEPHGTFVFGAGKFNWRSSSPVSHVLYAMDSEKKVTRLPDAPVPLTVTRAVFNSDPVSGDIIVVRRGELYSLDLAAETKQWTHHTNRKPPFRKDGAMAARIRDYGVLYFLVPNTNKVYLYKHAEKSQTPQQAP